MDIFENTKGDVLVIKAVGRLDSVSSPKFSKRALSLIDSDNKKIVMDFSKLNYISSASLHVLLMITKKLKSIGGKVTLAALQETVKEVFEMSGFSSIFESYANTDEALTKF